MVADSSRQPTLPKGFKKVKNSGDKAKERKTKKLVLTILAIVAFVLTTGTFAYTYTGSTLNLNSAIADEPYASVQNSNSQPNWQTLMPQGQYTSSTIWPEAAGDSTEFDISPATGENWDKVVDQTADDWNTYVYNTSKFYHTDLYNLNDLSEDIPETTRITSITVHFRFAGSDLTTGYAKAVIKTNGASFEGSEKSQYGTIFIDESYTWTSNPATSQAWTLADINGLQAGVSLQKERNGYIAACTQLYVVVNYEYSITEGEICLGDLFDITPHPDYNGDMLVKIYLLNTSELIKAYKYLNLECRVVNSLEASQIPGYQILSIENGFTQFSIEGGSAASYTVEVIGGSYRLISDDTDEWAAGWSITPELYCEVDQR